jgi:hypothetical protein
MFEIRCIVSDKKLADVLKAVNGLTLEPPAVFPGEVANGHSPPLNDRATKYAQGGATGMLQAFIKKTKPKQLSSSQLKKFLMDHGYSDNGYSYALKRFLERGVLKKTKTPYLYEVRNG